jgi:hypothetical protein
MTGSSRNRNALLVIGTALACAAVVLTIGIAYPRPVSNPMLGAEWECHRSAGILTTCRRLSHAEPLIHRTRSLATDLSRV